MATKAIKIIEWKVIGETDNFTILGIDDKNNVYFWKDKQWNLL
jgi:hypothetical protein